MRGLFRPIFDKWGKFAPPGGAFDQQCFPGGDAAETHRHGKRNHMRAFQDRVGSGYSSGQGGLGGHSHGGQRSVAEHGRKGHSTTRS